MRTLLENGFPLRFLEQAAPTSTRHGQGAFLDGNAGEVTFRGLPVDHRLVAVAGMSLRIASLRDATDLLDQPDFAKRFLENDVAPYGVELWPSAIMLAEVLAREKAGTGKTAIELGCGLGLVSIVAARLGWRIVASDHESTALQFADYNARLNDAPIAEFATLDWRDPLGDGRFDRVLAADVLYQLSNHAPILSCIARLLSPTGIALIADPNRSVADQFPQFAQTAGFAVETEPVSGRNPEGQQVTGRIFRLRQTTQG